MAAAASPRASSARGFLHIDDALDQRLRVSTTAWRSEMLCERPDVTDCVYPEFNEGTHVFDDGEQPRDQAGAASLDWLGGLDFGFRSPSVLLLAMLDGGNVLSVMDEIYQRSCVTSRMIELTKARCAELGIDTGASRDQEVDPAAPSHGTNRLRWIGADPAGLSRNDQTGVSNIALWRRAGFRVRACGTTIEAGIELVRARLAPPRGGAGSNSIPGLLVHRRCVNLIRALREYHFVPERPQSETPVKDGPVHAADAVRYLIVTLDGAAAGRAASADY